MENNQKTNTQNRVTRAAKSFKDGADKVFDSVENVIEKTESTAMNAVDKTSNFINKRLDRDNK